MPLRPLFLCIVLLWISIVDGKHIVVALDTTIATSPDEIRSELRKEFERNFKDTDIVSLLLFSDHPKDAKYWIKGIQCLRRNEIYTAIETLPLPSGHAGRCGDWTTALQMIDVNDHIDAVVLLVHSDPCGLADPRQVAKVLKDYGIDIHVVSLSNKGTVSRYWGMEISSTNRLLTAARHPDPMLDSTPLTDTERAIVIVAEQS